MLRASSLALFRPRSAPPRVWLPLASWLLATAVLAEHTPITDAAHAARALALDARLETPLPVQPNTPWNAKFVTQQGSYTFALEPVSARTNDFQVKVQVAGGGFQAHVPPPARTYRGTIVQIPGSRVAASVLDDGVYALVLVPNGTDLYLQPSSSLAHGKATPNAYSVTRAGTDEAMHGASASSALVSADSVPLSNGTASCAIDGLCIAELALDTSYATYITLGADPDDVLDVGEAAVNMANLRYEDQFAISHRVTTLVVRTSQADDPYDGATSRDQILPALNSNWCDSCNSCTLCQTEARRDYVYLMSGLSGASPTGNLCFTHGAHGFGFMSGLQNPTGVAAMIHEMGHGWRAPHYDQCVGIMLPGGLNVTRPFCGDPVLMAIEGKRDEVATICLDTLIPDGRIFADGHEAGDLAAWPVVTDPDDRLTVIAGGAVLFGSHSLEIDLAGTAVAWIADELPTDESEIQIRFHVDAGGLLNTFMGGMVGPALRFLELRSMADVVTVSVELRRTTGIVPLELRLTARRDNGSNLVGPWTGVPALANGPVEVIVAWDAASAAGANDGVASVQIDGVTVASATALDNDLGNIDSVRFGAVTTTGGAFVAGNHVVLDGYESRRSGPFTPPL